MKNTVKVTRADVAGYRNALDSLREKFHIHLEPHGVEWPPEAQAAGLVLLYLHLGRPVSKDDVAEYVRKVLDRPGLSGDQQLRHLRARGWHVNGSGRGHGLTNCMSDGSRVPKGAYVLVSMSPHPLWLSERRMTRTGRLQARSFTDLQILYGWSCAMCGRQLRSGADKGHMDPRKPLTLDNTIPLCTSCNNWQGDRVVLDSSGRVCAILDPDFVVNAGEDIQEKVLNILLALRKERTP